jgi:Rod binding domain-containing protein
MEVTALHRPVRAADVQLDRLMNNPQLTGREKIGEVCRQFEAVLARQILGAAQKTHFASTMNPETFSGGVYQDLITNQLADSISRSGALGLARSLERELQHELKPTGPATDGDPKV